MVRTDPQGNSIQWFREASPYINAHRGRTLVLCVPGQLLASEAMATLVHDIALLSHLGLRLVLCYGLREQVDAQLAENQVPRFVDGRRVTDDSALTAIMKAAGLARCALEARLSLALPNTPMAGAQLSVSSGNFIAARPFGIHDGIDFEHTGQVRDVQAPAMHALLQAGHLVLVPPLGYSLTGEIFNLPAEEVAVETAVALKADKLVFLSANPLQDASGLFVHEASAAHAIQLADEAHVDDHQARLLRRVASASQRGVARTHLIDAQDPDALLREFYTRDGSGTLITHEPWEHSRAACIEDVGGIIALMQPLQQDGTLARRSREQLELDIDHFVVCERDGTIAACAALFIHEDVSDNASEKVAEIACVATHPDYRGSGRAARLVRDLENLARHAGNEQVYLLSTRTGHWFVERGYASCPIEQLPFARRVSYDQQRNSKLYVKQLVVEHAL